VVIWKSVLDPRLRTSAHLLAAPSPDLGLGRRLYIPALDGVRFFAFFLVFLHHSGLGDQFAAWSPRYAAPLQTIARFGWAGVDVFLTLSGFLITVLLLRELDATRRVDVVRFYARRVLRIWPLYYLALGLGFFAVPILLGQVGTPAYKALLLEHLFPFATLFGNFSSATMLPSLDALGPTSIILGPLWTIALEEQFYLIFPLVISAAGPGITLRAVLRCTLGIVAFSVATRLYIMANGIPYPMVWMNTLAHLDPIALGIIGAVIWHRQRRLLLGIRPYGADVLLAIGALWLVVSYPQIGTSTHTVWQISAVAAASLLLIGAALRYQYLGLALGWGPIAWLGRISYGLYVYHGLARYLYLQGPATRLPLELLHPPVRWLAEFFLVLLVTILLAAVSYYGFERHFLRIKERFVVVRSRPA